MLPNSPEIQMKWILIKSMASSKPKWNTPKKQWIIIAMNAVQSTSNTQRGSAQSVELGAIIDV